jgi:aryl-alcohol dehydrogenase-like predicted oxidoreductase
MVRAGLLVPGDLLDVSAHLADLFKLEPAARWGMAPFGGLATDPLWEKINPRQFLAPHQSSSPAQAVVRAAFALPAVTRIAVGTDDAQHLDDLMAGLNLELDESTVTRYRVLLRSHAPSGDVVR